MDFVPPPVGRCCPRLQHLQLIAAASLCFVWSAHPADASRPNIVYFLVDDLGFADVGFNGSQDVRTPNIDRLAKEGGVRVCAFATWPGRIPAGTTNHEPMHPVDWYPTLLKLAGASPRQKLALDGLDYGPTLTRGAKSPHDAILLAGTTPGKMAIRMGDWKLLLNASEKDAEETPADEPKPTGKVELYNLADDVSESKNLAASQPEMVKQLRVRLGAFLENAAPPGNEAATKRAAAKAQRVQPNAAGADQ